MIILKYDNSITPVDIEDTYNSIKSHYPDEEVIVIPQKWDILLDCEIDELIRLKEKIEEIIIKTKEEENESKIN